MRGARALSRGHGQGALVSQTDSFIDEVTEELRRDRMNRLARRYGWIAVLVIVIGVGIAGFFEWRKAQAESQARALGDAVYAALEREAPETRALSLADIDAPGAAGAIAAMLAASELAGSDPEAALAELEAVAQDTDVPPLYREVAVLKQVMLPDGPLLTGEKLTRLEPLTAPGAPLRPIALEQIALVHLERGDEDAAIETLQRVVNAAEASAALRDRAAQILVVLGVPVSDLAAPEAP